MCAPVDPALADVDPTDHAYQGDNTDTVGWAADPRCSSPSEERFGPGRDESCPAAGVEVITGVYTASGGLTLCPPGLRREEVVPVSEVEVASDSGATEGVTVIGSVTVTKKETVAAGVAVRPGKAMVMRRNSRAMAPLLQMTLMKRAVEGQVDYDRGVD
jgi:hypothetical protein